MDDPDIELANQALTSGIDVSHRFLKRTHFINMNLLGSDVSGSTSAIKKLKENNLHNFDREDATHVSVNPELQSLKGWGGHIELGKDNGGHWQYEAEWDW